jgi:putative tryptophan/tyrosine transport system substrate-binding protein
MRRREFISLLGGAMAVRPLAALGQSNGPVRRFGALMNFAADAGGGKERLAAFRQGLRAAGWEEGRNLRIDTRWTDGRDAELRKHAAELVALDPEVILAWATPTVFALQRVSRTVPRFLRADTRAAGANVVAAFRKGLREIGFVEGRNVIPGMTGSPSWRPT